MKLTTREGKGSKLTIKEMDDNLLYLESLNKSNNPIIKAYFESKLQLSGSISTGQLYNGLETSLNRGIFLPYVENLELPDNGFYIISCVETYLRFSESFFNSDSSYSFIKYLLKIETIDYSIAASVETYLIFLEAIRFTTEMKNPVLNQDFLNKIKDIEQYNTLNSAEIFNRTLDRGIVEIGLINGKSQLDILFYISNQLGIINSNSYSSANIDFGDNTWDILLDRGIVILDTNKFPHINQLNIYPKYKGLILMSIEAFLAYLEVNTETPVPA